MENICAKNIYEKKTGISFGLFSYTVFCFWLLITDAVQYFLAIDYRAALVLSMTVAVIIYKKLLSRFIYAKPVHVTKTDAAAIGIIVLFALLGAAIPDYSWDTLNYHTYFQQFLGRDFIRYDFFPNRVMNEVSLYFGDRMFYVFRYFLGFRMGTVLNVLAAILLYTGLKGFAVNVLESAEIKTRDICVCAITLSAVLIENVFLELNLYYVDICALPFLVECMQAALFDKKTDTCRMLFLAFICGVSVSIKLSNVFFLFPLALFYVFRFRKSLRPAYLLSFFVALLPLALYFYISQKLTGNPLFPYLNGLFKSPYFALDVSPNTLSDFYRLFGPKSFMQFIFWPVYIARDPNLASNTEFYRGCLLILPAVFLAAILFKKRHGKLSYVWAMFIVFYIVYLTAINGYNRYAVIMDSLSVLITGLYSLIWFKEKGILKKVLSFASAAGVIAVMCLTVKSIYFDGVNWLWTGDIKNRIAMQKANSSLCFNDFQSGIDNNILSDIDCWYITEFNSGYASLIKPAAPMITSSFGVTNDTTALLYNERIKSLAGKGIYTVATKYGAKHLFEETEKSGFSVQDIYVLGCDYYDLNRSMLLVKIAPETVQTHTYRLTCDNPCQIPLSPYSQSGYKARLFIGPDIDSYGYKNSCFTAKAFLCSDVEKTELSNVSWNTGEKYAALDIRVPKEKINSESKIILSLESSQKDSAITILEQK